MKFHRHPWNDTNISYVIQWWPHFGSVYCAETLGITAQQVKSKVDKLELHMLPKVDRYCMQCKENKQVSRRYGSLCRRCSLSRRMKVRCKGEVPFDKWVLESLRTLRHRSKTQCDLTVEYLKDLWNEQDGCCFYSGEKLLVPYYGSGKRPFTASIDRIDSGRGYEKGNVVWSSWICNIGKSFLPISEYIDICQKVVEHTIQVLASSNRISP